MIVTGIHGFIGQRAVAQLQAEVFPHELLYLDYGTASARDTLRRWACETAPDVIIHTAAISDIGACERNPEVSYRANVLLPEALAAACAACGARLVAFSSDQVYTGAADDGPYTEDALLPPPTNVYARHKLEAEQRVLAADPSAVLLRATWMYDMPLYGHANRGNFLMNTLRAAALGQPVIVHDQHRAVTYARQVVALLPAAAVLPGGVYNYGSENPLTMADTAQALLDAFGLHAAIVPSGEHRHALWMDCSRLAAQGLRFDTTAEGFRRCAADYGMDAR